MNKEQRRRAANAQRQRENADPDEGVRPLPWFLVMLLGAMAMWGAFYIYSTPSGEDSAYGDQRTVADLRPPVALAGSEWVTGDEKVLTNILLHGVTGEMVVKGNTYQGAMPAWNAMSDGELAAVITYIRAEWGNSGAPVLEATVKAQREATKDRTEPYKGGKDLKS